ncbi:MAG: hypothetical protein WC915_06460 [archaeon]|jgi:hypothetical protein
MRKIFISFLILLILGSVFASYARLENENPYVQPPAIGPNALKSIQNDLINKFPDIKDRLDFLKNNYHNSVLKENNFMTPFTDLNFNYFLSEDINQKKELFEQAKESVYLKKDIEVKKIYLLIEQKVEVKPLEAMLIRIEREKLDLNNLKSSDTNLIKLNKLLEEKNMDYLKRLTINNLNGRLKNVVNKMEKYLSDLELIISNNNDDDIFLNYQLLEEKTQTIYQKYLLNIIDFESLLNEKGKIEELKSDLNDISSIYHTLIINLNEIKQGD